MKKKLKAKLITMNSPVKKLKIVDSREEQPSLFSSTQGEDELLHGFLTKMAGAEVE